METNKIFQMDAIKFLQTLPDKSVDVVITDPPYFQPATHYSPSRKQIFTHKCISDLSILEHFFRAFLKELTRVTKEDGFIYVFCDSQSYPLVFAGLYSDVKRMRTIVWDKITAFNGYTWRHQHELIAFAEMPKSKIVPTGDGDIIKQRVTKVEDRIHPAEKPIDLLNRLIEKHKDKDLFLDCFAGSGNTLIAVKQLGKNFIGCESDEKYFKIASERLESATPQTQIASQSVLTESLISVKEEFQK